MALTPLTLAQGFKKDKYSGINNQEVCELNEIQIFVQVGDGVANIERLPQGSSLVNVADITPASLNPDVISLSFWAAVRS